MGIFCWLGSMLIKLTSEDNCTHYTNGNEPFQCDGHLMCSYQSVQLQVKCVSQFTCTTTTKHTPRKKKESENVALRETHT